MLLTIAIPTYNRNQILLENLNHLLSQVTDECRIIILDNCSDTPVDQTLGAALGDLLAWRIEVIRNRTNIGANANILRCFELCETEWLWVLGDDDKPMPDAVRTILDAIRERGEYLFVNFASEICLRERTILTKGIDEFVEKLDSFGNVLFASSGIYRVSPLVHNLKLGYTYAYSMAPHITALLVSLGGDGLCCLSNEQIVIWCPPPVHQQWSLIAASLGHMTLLELPMRPAIRQQFAAKILYALPSLEYVVVQLVLTAVATREFRSSLYLYDQICSRLYYFDRSLIRKAKVFLYRWLLRFPKVGYNIVSFSYRLSKGQRLSERNVPDRFTRI